MSELKRLRRVVEQKAAAVDRDKALLGMAVDRTLERFRRNLTRPVTLLALFAAGLVVGAARRGDSGEHEEEDGGRRRAAGGKLTRTAAVLLSAARLIEMTRKADRFRRPPGSESSEPAGGSAGAPAAGES